MSNTQQKVYVLDLIHLDEGVQYQDLTDEQFIEYATANGTIYSLRGFENAINQDDFDNVNSVIRII